MLYFKDFNEPLSKGKNIGESLIDWFNKQEPFQQWEKEWYYGMILNGDPTLYLKKNDFNKSTVIITKPENAIYFRDKKIFSFPRTIIIGKIKIEVKLWL